MCMKSPAVKENMQTVPSLYSLCRHWSGMLHLACRLACRVYPEATKQQGAQHLRDAGSPQLNSKP